MTIPTKVYDLSVINPHSKAFKIIRWKLGDLDHYIRLAIGFGESRQVRGGMERLDGIEGELR